MARKSSRRKNIESVAAITEVFPNGQKVTAVAIEYSKKINNAKISKSTFFVKGRTITKVYANNASIKAPNGIDGKYIIIELSPNDKNASTIIEVMGDRVITGRKEVKVSVTQLKDILTTDGEKLVPDSKAMVNDKEINLIADDFVKLEFKDIKTGIILKYNLFIPKGYDKNKSYPMVVFIADRGPNCERGDLPVIQGLGGVIWATQSEQAKHECFVLVPQFPYHVIFDDYTATDHFESAINLINSIVNQYNIDTNRLYATGQSQGVLMSLEMGIRYPEMFAGMLLVSGFWNPRTVSVLACNNIWVVVSEGDERSYPIMTACMATLEAAGAKISRARWDGRQNEAEIEASIKQMIAEGSNIKYSVFKDGTYLTPCDENETVMSHEAYSHVHTWRLAYTFEGLRDWLFAQIKSKSTLQEYQRRFKDIALTQKPQNNEHKIGNLPLIV